MWIPCYNGEKSIDFHLGRDSEMEVKSIVDHYNIVSLDLLEDFRTALNSLVVSCSHSCIHLRRIQFNVQNTACGL